jgi:hypothetical protein
MLCHILMFHIIDNFYPFFLLFPDSGPGSKSTFGFIKLKQTSDLLEKPSKTGSKPVSTELPDHSIFAQVSRPPTSKTSATSNRQFDTKGPVPLMSILGSSTFPGRVRLQPTSSKLYSQLVKSSGANLDKRPFSLHP